MVRAGHLQQLEVGTWNHLAISYDGSGERAGLSLFLNGEIIPTQGSEYFTSLQGSIRTDRPLLLGKQVTKGKDEDHYEESYFKGGAIADFRIFNRAITVEEARLVSPVAGVETRAGTDSRRSHATGRGRLCGCTT